LIATLALLLLSALANPGAGADLQRLVLSGNAEPDIVAQLLESGLAELNGQTRPQECMDAFLAGELYRQAAAATSDQDYQHKALETFRAMRVDYMDLPTGSLGYIGEARVHLQNGDPEQSLAVLSPLLNADGVTRIKRLAEIESLEALLLIEPGRAISQARQLGEPAHWFLARAHAKQGDRDNALELARSEAVVTSAPNYQRLKLIADLGALSDTERFAWAQALVEVDKHDEALALLREHAPPGSARLHAVLLQQLGDKQAAVIQWRRAINEGAGPQAQLAYAACLESMVPEDPNQKPAALDAYRQLIESDADDAMRRDALRRWVHLNGLAGANEPLALHADLVSSDPYLRYARAVVQRDTADPEFIITELKAVTAEIQDDAVRGSAVLLLARVTPDPREALALLEKHWDELIAQPTLAEPARSHRVGLWIELGMVDRAVDQMLADPDAKPPELLQVAGPLADRYEDGIVGSTQARVLLLTSAAITAAPDDEYTALAAAKLLLRVAARADAIKVLNSLSISEAKLILAETLREMDRPQEAVDALNDLQTPDAALQRGLSLLDLNQADRALVEIRNARKTSHAGSDFWWDATLALVTVQIDMNDRQAAEEVLRVAEALYPVNARPRLRTKLNAIKKELQS
jgi:Tetratricopeptide repeat